MTKICIPEPTNDNDEPKFLSTLLQSGGRRKSDDSNETSTTNDKDNVIIG